MIRKPRGKLTRRDGSLDLFSGHRSEESKCKKDKPPGQHGANQGRQTGYCKQLRAKQMVKRMCGIGEKQFRNAFNKAARKKGSTGENLIQFVECRLDNVVYRMGFACTRAEARQLVSHRSILVNGKIVNIPSYQVAVGDVVSVREKSKGQLRIQAALALAQGRSYEWVEVDSAQLSGTFKRIPDRDQVFQNVNEQLIVELYSK